MTTFLQAAWYVLVGMVMTTIGMYWGAYLQRTYGGVTLLRIRTQRDTTHRYRQALNDITKCDKCAGCRMLAQTALAPDQPH